MPCPLYPTCQGGPVLEAICDSFYIYDAFRALIEDIVSMWYVSWSWCSLSIWLSLYFIILQAIESAFFRVSRDLAEVVINLSQVINEEIIKWGGGGHSLSLLYKTQLYSLEKAYEMISFDYDKGFTSVREKTELLDKSSKTIDIFPNRSEALIMTFIPQDPDSHPSSAAS